MLYSYRLFFSKAELSLTIKNRGDEAYRPDLYGSKITIERKITKDGASNYRILNEHGKVWYTLTL